MLKSGRRKNHDCAKSAASHISSTAKWRCGERHRSLLGRDRLGRTCIQGVISVTFRPLHDRVVIRRIDPVEKTAGGIFIPDTAREKPTEGEVIAVGPGARDDDGKIHALDVKAGDRVLFGKWSGTEVKLDGVDLIIMKESDIMGIIAN